MVVRKREGFPPFGVASCSILCSCQKFFWADRKHPKKTHKIILGFLRICSSRFQNLVDVPHRVYSHYGFERKIRGFGYTIRGKATRKSNDFVRQSS